MPPDSSAAAEGQAAAAARRIALQMLEERGRGAVLVGVSRVDASLERLLQAVLQPSTSGRDALFQPDRPLGSFGALARRASACGRSAWPTALA